MKRFVLFFALVLIIVRTYGQTKTISGLVTDDKRTPIQSASVFVKGTQVGTVTNAEGRFTLSVPNNAKTLVISSVGFTEREVSISSGTQFDISLSAPVGSELSEVVVTALGITRDKRSLGYATQNIKAEEIADKGEINLVNALNGKVAGVDITGASGAAGASANINIRGITSFTGSNQPLFVIDGIPISNDLDRTGNSLFDQQPPNRALDININDIESINVLKGAAASALYGSRAASGAIIITTKKGNAGRGKAKVSYNTNYSVQNVYGLPEFQNEYGQGASGLFNSISAFSFGPKFGSTPTLSNGLLTTTGAVIDYRAYPDNIRSFYEQGSIWDNSLSISSGDKKQNFNFSIGNTNQKGMLPNTSLNRTSLTAGFGSALTDKLSFSGGVTYTISKQVGILQGNGANSAMFQLFSVPRSFDLEFYKRNYKNPDGTNNWPLSANRDNPYFAAYEDPLTSQLNRTFGNIKLGYDLTSWLNVSYRLGIDQYTDRRKRIIAVNSFAFTAGRVLEDNFFRSELNGDLIITAKKQHLFLDKLDATLLVGHNINQRKFQNVFVQANTLGIPGFYNTSNGSDFNGSGETNSLRRLVGYYAQLSLAYDNYLFLELTGRADKSSTLPVDKSTYFYPSVTTSFVFTDALKLKSKFLNYGKIRASVAKVGKDATAYQLQSTFFSYSYGNNVAQFNFPYGSTIGFGASRTIGNPTLNPEFTTAWEIGTNLSFLNGKVTLDAAYFYQNSTDQIFSVAVPTSTGFASQITNVGSMVNKGVELLLTFTPISTKNLKWDLTANFTRIRNKVVYIDEGIFVSPIPGQRFTNAEASIVQGQPYGVILGNKWRRSPDGQMIINPATGTPLSSIAGQVIGDPNRDYTTGLSSTLTYKRVFFSFLIDYKQGGDIMSWSASTFRSLGALKETGVDRELPRVWPGVIETSPGRFEPNNIQISAQTYWNSMGSTTTAGDLGVWDATTFRVREVSVGIDLPNTVFGAKIFTSARLTAYARNLFYYAPNSPMDPEVNTQGAGNIRGLELQSSTNSRTFGAAFRVTL
jgi:TonB-linked SusC/RagA family outer membrane protein